MNGCLKGVGCMLALLIVLFVAVGSGGAVTWFNTSCAVDSVGASVTMQGWGAPQACNDINSGFMNILGDAGNILHHLPVVGGASPTSSSQGTAYSSQNCLGWNGDVHYSVAHESFTQNPIAWATGDLRASYWCDHLPKTNPFGLPFRLPGT